MKETKSFAQHLHQASAQLLVTRSSKPCIGPGRRKLGVLALGLIAGQAQAAQAGEWEIRNALLLYAESDRVQAIEPVFQGTRYFENDRLLSTKLVLDSLTGASANGVVPSSEPQTFTQPSGGGQFTTAAGETPLDDTFRDTRVALSANWKQPLWWDGLSGTVGLNASNEYDYFSLGASGLLNYDFNRKNSTLTLGLSFSSDQIEPVGGIPTPRAEAQYHRGDPATIGNEFDDDSERQSRLSSDDKSITDILLGYTQVLSRRSVLQFNYSLSQASGYTTDPCPSSNDLGHRSGFRSGGSAHQVGIV